MISAEPPLPASAAGPPAARAFFGDVNAAYRQAAAQAGVHEYTLQVVGGTVRLRFAGGALLPTVLRALEHHIVPAAEQADLTVQMWDVASTGVPLPRRPWEWRDNPARGDVLSLNDERVRVAYDHFGHVLSLFDREQNLALWVTVDAARSASRFGTVPLLEVLHWWLHERGMQVVHAGALGTPAGGVLLAGKGGAGKSTTAVACLSSRLSFAADDYCALSGRDLEVHNLFGSARIAVDNLPWFPELGPLFERPAAPEGDGDKAAMFLHRHLPEKLIRRFPVRAVLLPRVTGTPRSRLVPAPRLHALRELSVSTINQRAGSGRVAFEAIAGIVKQVPCYALELGTDMRQLADLVEEFAGAR